MLHVGPCALAACWPVCIGRMLARVHVGSLSSVPPFPISLTLSGADPLDREPSTGGPEGLRLFPSPAFFSFGRIFRHLSYAAKRRDTLRHVGKALSACSDN